ncbi:MAG: NADH:ubiquinone reductase (Na(+)-transporting) subunit C [Bacteroidales bacterium]|nr:NADH:ubiquinone reductase (Na(+)-transporting) subunit C [Bacteroidales bacterium]
MNTNSNTYTVIYSTVLVVVVAAVLAFAAMSLKPRQDENIKIETISKVLMAATQSSSSVKVEEDTDVMALYAEKVSEAFYVDGYGKAAGEMNTGNYYLKDIVVATTGDLKKQNDIIKQIENGNTGLLASLRLPVYIFSIDGKDITVIPCYGAGLWGPIWGYIAVAEDGQTIEGAIFDHKSETPGLGAKIAEEPFYSQFPGKKFSDGDVKFSVVKGGANGDISGVDAISGATITSRALGSTINTWAKYYEPYFKSAAAAAQDEECCGCCEETEETANNEEE